MNVVVLLCDVVLSAERVTQGTTTNESTTHCTAGHNMCSRSYCACVITRVERSWNCYVFTSKGGGSGKVREGQPNMSLKGEDQVDKCTAVL